MVLKRTRGAPLFIAATVLGITLVILGSAVSEEAGRTALIVTGVVVWIALGIVAPWLIARRLDIQETGRP